MSRSSTKTRRTRCAARAGYGRSRCSCSDNSAFGRLAHPSLPASRAEEIADHIERREIAVCLPRLPVGPEVETTALRGQAELARTGHHRLPPVGLIVAAVADAHDVGVLHYDADYDLIAARTSLEFESVWLAQRGSI